MYSKHEATSKTLWSQQFLTKSFNLKHPASEINYQFPPRHPGIQKKEQSTCTNAVPFRRDNNFHNCIG